MATTKKKPAVKAKAPAAKASAKPAVKKIAVNPAVKKATPKTIFAASMAFYIPRKGTTVNELFIDTDYSQMAKKVLKDFSEYASSEFTVNKVVAMKKANTFTIYVDHKSWDEDAKIQLDFDNNPIRKLIDYCLYKAHENGLTIQDHFKEDGYLDGDGIVITESRMTIK